MTDAKFFTLCAVGALLTVAYFVGDKAQREEAAQPRRVAQVNAATMPATPAPIREPSLSSVCAVAQIYIEDRLKSPGSGSFDICRIVSLSEDKTTVVIAGNFTATNAFNAKIRSSYAATLVRKPEALPTEDNFGTWRIASLQTGN
jgi:hypothetical protein